MKNTFHILSGALITLLAVSVLSSETCAQSLQFNAVHTLQYSLSGHSSTSSTYTVPSGKVAKVIDAAGTSFCYMVGTSSTSYSSVRFVLNGFEIPSLTSTNCSGGTSNTLYKVPLDQWMKAGDTFQLKMPNYSHGSPGTPSGNFLLTIIEYNIVP